MIKCHIDEETKCHVVVVKPKYHHTKFVWLCIAGVECCFGFVIFLDWDLPVDRFEIQSGEHIGSVQRLQGVISPWHWLSVFCSTMVQSLLVCAEARSHLFFSCHDFHFGPWALRGLDDTTPQHLVYLARFFLLHIGFCHWSGSSHTLAPTACSLNHA